ncbi:MAG TPA: hypothetical protein VI524_06535 [Anaerolineales bacterium]|nr:hypothetical protein [Anaerolineales bacterium]
MRVDRNSIKILAAIALVMLLVGYAVLRWSNESVGFEKARQISDTRAYIRISGESLLTRDFWAAARPAVYPLVLKIFRADPGTVSAFQALFSILAWFTLAASVAWSLTGILRPVSMVLILLLSLDRHIAGWDAVILTESVSLSLLALFLSGWIWLLRRWSVGRAVWLCLVAFLWTFSRDTNAWMVLLIAGMMVLAVIFWGAKKQFIFLAAVFFLIFSVSNLAAGLGARWVFPFQNVLAQRILADQEALSFFSGCGMPVTPELLRLAGGNAASQERAFYADPALGQYRTWLRAEGKLCYIRWLLASPVQSLSRPLIDFASLVAFDDVDRFFPQRYERALPGLAERLLHPRDAPLWIWALISLAAVIALVQKSWRSNPLWAVFIGVCLLIYPHLFIVWHGDALGTPRHALAVSIQFMLSFWLLILLLAERLLARRRPPRSV